MRYNRIVFVSQDDTYRAPMAATIMKRKIKNKDVVVESRGMVVHFPEPANAKGVQVAKDNGLNLARHTATQISMEDFGVDVLVLVMTEKIKYKIYNTFTKAVNVYSIKEFVGGTGDVEVPYGRAIEEYEEHFEKFDALIDDVIERINNLSNRNINKEKLENKNMEE